ncbi:hypothetical protein GOP47_0024744 [Adiantum capillus-veneris]|uniref:Calcineurin-like phosphoesterase domain-containing protein n=1 Tax=Adiantum capillus-veneris TaxID=13818 RepID=A0A9D4Z3X5_ADICA|nr:hypothetical protein GOP47_0024744 [Adiantum capillus-veneris]
MAAVGWLWCFIGVLLLNWRWGLSSSSLNFRGNTFTMALFADLHFGEAASEEWGPLQDVKSQRVMSFVLDAEKPDLVIFLGDILTANNMVCHNATNYWTQAISATLQRNISWASVFGNHDDMSFEWPVDWFGVAGIPGEDNIDHYFRGTTRAELMAHDMSFGASFSVKGSRSLWPSVSNYAMQIFSQNSTNLEEPLLILYFLDSGGGSYPELISARQISWFHEVASELNPDQRVPELAFWHIPTQGYVDIAPPPGSRIESPCVGSINLETVAPQVVELGFMELLSERRSMKAAFVGHNHGLDWCCPTKSAGMMYLCFARHTGYGGYGTWTRGARIIEQLNELDIWDKIHSGGVNGVYNV